MKDKQKIIELAEKLKLLFGFCTDLIPDKELLKDTAKLALDHQSFAMSAAPILEAFGENWEKAEFEARLKLDRANALYHLIDTLDRTEKEWVKFSEKQRRIAGERAKLRGILGM
jgi:hypothetical protein